MVIQMSENSQVTLFPVPTVLVMELIKLYSKVLEQEVEKVKKAKCDFCNIGSKQHFIKCNMCNEEFVNCNGCWNNGRFQCGYPCQHWVCQGCTVEHKKIHG